MVKNKYIRILISIFFSFFSCITIFCNRSIEIKNKYDFINVINCDIVCSSIVGFLLVLAFFRFLNKYYDKNILLFSSILALIFSLCEFIGFYMDKYSAFFSMHISIYNILFNVIIFLGYLFLLFAIIVLIVNYLLEKKVFSKYLDKHEYTYFSDNIQSVFSVTAFLSIFWGIYYLIFFPGIVTEDSTYQINQAMGFLPLTDENPFLHTYIEGIIIKVGTWLFGNINLGIACFSFIQMIIIATIISCVIRYLAKKQVPATIRLIILLFYSLHPVIAAYSITLWKDVWMAVFVLIYIIFLFEICNNQSNFFKSKFKLILFALSILCILFSKGTGMIIIILSFPCLFFICKKQYKALLFTLIICFLSFFIIRYVAIDCFNVKSGHIREPLSIPIQQISRTVKYHKDELTEYEYKTINEILPVEEVGKLYEPKLSDNTKSLLNEQNFSSYPSKYIKIWIKLGIKHPFTYLDSFLSNSYGYWYPETTYWEIANSSYIKMLNKYNYNYDINKEYYHELQTLNNIKNIVCFYVNKGFRKAPIINLLFSIGVYFWINFICMTIALLKKKYSLIPIFLTVCAIFLICIGSPVHAEFRYAYPAIFTLPIVILYTVFDFKNSRY